jgi:hypothetical protein
VESSGMKMIFSRDLFYRDSTPIYGMPGLSACLPNARSAFLCHSRANQFR